MNLHRLEGFIKFAQNSANPFVRQQAGMASKNLMEQGEEEQEQTPDLKKKTPGGEDKSHDEIDMFLSKAMPEIDNPDTNDTTFGKSASAYVKDIKIDQLAKEVQSEIKRFIPDGKAMIVMYGMVVDELLPKVDPKNFTSASENVRKNHRGEDREDLKTKLLEKAKKKFILMMNDRIVDGHHFLAKAKELGVTSSLNVLDLTPARLAEKRSMFKALASKVK